MESKICSKCKIEKPIKDFNKKGVRGYWKSYCKECENEYARIRRQKRGSSGIGKRKIYPVYIDAKICRKCNTKKPAGEFYKQNGSSDGLRSWCKKCTNQDNNKRHGIKRYKSDESSSYNPEYQKRYREKNPEKYKKIRAKGKMKYRQLCKEELRNDYIKTQLYNQGLTYEQIAANPILIELQRIKLKTKREIKTKLKNDNENQ